MKRSDLPAGWIWVHRGEFRKPLSRPRRDLVVFRTRTGWKLAEDRLYEGTGLWPYTEYNTAKDAIDFADRSWR